MSTTNGPGSGGAVPRAATGTPVLRRLNTRSVLNAVRRAAPEPQRIADLTGATGLTRPTVAQAIEDLVAEGLLSSASSAEGGMVGRPAARYSINGHAAPVLGIDLGVHTVAVAVGDLAGATLAVSRRSVEGSEGSDILAALDAAVDEALAEADLRPEDLAAVVAGTSGIVDRSTDQVRLALGDGAWSSFNLRERLQPRFECPVTIENNANLVAISAVVPGLTPTVIGVQWGEALGAGLVVDGRLHRGASASAGEIGFISLGGTPVHFGSQRGPLEASIGTGGIVRRATAAAAAAPGSALARALAGDTGPGAAAVVFAQAADGDAIAQSVVDAVAREFASALAPVVLALNPDTIVIAGGVARAGEVLTRAIHRHLRQLTLHCPSVELSAHAQDAVVVGAMQIARDELWAEMLAEGGMLSR
ncbi:MAG TPA: ROK family protein [Dermatophilaceae bacterium]|nr:ROK family protein [Dermatophilaceae bacterium]